ncbi:NAD(P)-dependent oxidoreductase [Salinibacterium sp. ZJ450]|uniref:NAD(P)-dependent oxidoreductase n=1 Tax=Salinibacterium sp. ZJ450 TaxID=2708338 RepID=UPI00141EE691|nr:NAD(P)-dependent oxidoreductase [Salinibacterium sp. ZJ450]
MSQLTRPSVGFLGLGAMGLPMARRILEGGYRVIAADIAQGRVDMAKDAGIAASTDAAALTECQVLIVMVATPEDLASLASSEIFSQSTAIELVCVMSTVGADAVIGFQHVMAPLSIGVVDCPVTGGVAGAESGGLTIFAAGAAFEVQLAAEILSHTGTVKHCGTRVGDGQHVKVVNQVLATSHVVVAAEALALATRLGLDPKTTLQLISEGAGSSWMLIDRGPRMIQDSSSREAVTHLSILAKDAQLALQAAAGVGLDAVVLRAASEQWRAAIRHGLAEHDDSAIINIYTNSASS